MKDSKNNNAVFQVVTEVVSLFLFFLVLSVVYYYLADRSISFGIIFLKFCLILWGLFVIYGYLWGEFSPTVSIYFGLNYRTQCIYIASLISYFIIFLIFKQTCFLKIAANKINIFVWLGIWLYFDFIAPIIGLFIRRVFPVPALLITDQNSTEKILKWWGYAITDKIPENKVIDWLQKNSNEQGKIDAYRLILFDHTKTPFRDELTYIVKKYFTEFASIKSYNLRNYLVGTHIKLLSKYPGRGIQYRLKRLIDYSISSFALFMSAPIFLFIIICIKLDSPGPVFYRHRRLGKNMKPFDLLKFRTMYQDADKRLEQILASHPNLKAEYEKTFKLKKDPRITRTGKIIRQLSIDETPQVINIIKGDMSLVGPRPIIEKEISYYESYSLDLFRVLPGLSGLWQTSGRTETTYKKRVILDTHYVRSWSLLTDVKLLFKTIPAVISQKGAY